MYLVLYLVTELVNTVTVIGSNLGLNRLFA